MKRLLAGLLLIVLLLVPLACASPQASAPGVVPAPMPAPMPAPVPAPAMPPGKGDFAEGPSPVATGERMIVRTGEISLVVEDVVEARDEVARLAERFDGFVVSSRISGEGIEMRGNISVRVTDDSFDLALAELRALAVRVKSESTSSQDVTEQYIDLQARLKNAEATESQYLSVLEKAEIVEDILRVYDSLSRIRYEIEQIKGQILYLERTTSMSLISVYLEPSATGGELVRAGWSALEVLKSAVRGIIVFGQLLGTVVIWLLIFSPVWGAIAGVIYWRWRRRKKAAA